MARVSRRVRVVLIGLCVVLVLAPLATGLVLARMFPSSADLPWPALPAADRRHAGPGLERVHDFVESVHALRFEGAADAALAEVRTYGFVRDSPYLPADRVAAERVFSVAAGDVLVDEDLSKVKDANAIYEGRYALYLPAGTAVTAAIPDRAGARLSLGLMALPPFAAVQTCGARVEVHAGAALLQAIDLSARKEDFAWQDLDLPLPPGTDQVTLRTVAAADCAGRHAHVFASTPRVFAPRTGAAPLNVLYVNVCTVRADDLGAYGQARPSSPHLDALAQGGARFAEARSNSNWSKGSQTSALVGRYPSAVGNRFYEVPVGDFERSTVWHLAWPTLPDRFRAAGYETLALVDNIFLADYLRVGLDLGFERFRDNARHIVNGIDMTREAVEYLSARGDRPFFLYVNIANSHFRYRPPREFLEAIGFDWADVTGDTELALHLGEIAFTDALVGRMVGALDALGLRERTLVVVHADHGELLAADRNLDVTIRGDRPGVGQLFPGTRYKHGWTWYEDETRVPLLLNLPGRIAPQVVTRPVTLVDVAPTILRLAGLPVPPVLQGQDLLAPAEPERPSLVDGKQFRAVVQGGLKYVRFDAGLDGWRPHGDDGPLRHQPELLFDLAADPLERQDLSAARPDDLARLRRVLDERRPPLESLHLVAFEGPEGQRFAGSVELSAEVATATLRGQAPGDVVAVHGTRVDFEVTGGPPGKPPILAVSALRPAERVALAVRAQGAPLDPAAFRLGPYGVSFAADRTADGRLELSGPYLAALGCGAGQRPRFAPVDGPRVRWWTQRITDGGPQPFGAVDLDANVMDAMKDWGYAH